MRRYNPKEIEPKWQSKWEKDKTYKAIDFDKSRPKYVMLTEFPYPSGDGLHLGHVREYTLGDIMARHKRMSGFNVLYPMGYDEFGLPTENYAIKNKIAPQTATEQNVSNFQKQFESMGFSFDWDRKVRTADPNYYKWTQWLFLQFFKKGLAYQDEIDINWCPKCKTGLANEEVINGRHERCDTLVEKKTLKQWLLKITEYAERLIDGLDSVDYPSRIADQQINWIGRSKGTEIDFEVDGHQHSLKVFTTRPDTLFGATFMVIAPEHPLIEQIVSEEQEKEVNNYVSEAGRKSDIERQETDREKTGVFTGAYAINPINKQKIPIWVADYVLMGYGTGAIMAVPAHDERDHDFAIKYNISEGEVIEPVFGKEQGDETIKPSIIGIVHDPKNDTYLVLDWGPRSKDDRWGGCLFIGGGIEGSEDIIQTAKREITEETGYANLKFISKTEIQAHSYFYSNVKNKNMYAPCTGVLFELIDSEKQKPNLEAGEQNKFKIKWTKKEDIPQVVNVGIHHYMYERLVNNKVFTGEGIMVNSGKYDGINSSEAREKITADLVEAGRATEKTNYRLRDWIFSRQHYWGEPIPIIHCEKCGAVPVPDDQLPVKLPKVEKYEPSDSGESPLAAITDWVNTECPKCEGEAKRETDTMPNWAGSSWYYLRYFDANNDVEFADRKKLDYWGAVDMYLGGMEHTTLHLLYSRFWHQFFYDQGLVPTPEPYTARRGQGIILAEDGSKMSKSKGNVINPTTVIESGYGADALRMAIAFLAPFDQTTPWSPEGVAGTHRFLNRVWQLVHEYKDAKVGDKENQELDRALNRCIKKVSSDLLEMSFNTAVAALMECLNELYKIKLKDDFNSKKWPEVISAFVKLLSPFAPHVTEELWKELGETESVHVSAWPKHDEKALRKDNINIVVQVNGKLRANITVPAGSEESEVVELSKQDDNVKRHLSSEPKKIIFVKDRLVNFVV